MLLTFNFSFLAGTPFYAGMDPAGPVPAWDGLVIAVTCLATLFLFLHFELWPLTTVRAIMKQPILGIVWTVATLVIGGGAYFVGTRVVGMTPDTFLVTVPVPFLFGSTVLLTMLGGSASAAGVEIRADGEQVQAVESVVRPPPPLFPDQQAGVDELLEVVGKGWLGDPQCCRHVAGTGRRVRGFGDQAQEPEPDRIGQRLQQASQ